MFTKLRPAFLCIADDGGLDTAQNKPKKSATKVITYCWSPLGHISAWYFNTQNANWYRCSFVGKKVPSTSTTKVQGAKRAAMIRGVSLWDKPQVSVSFTHSTIKFLKQWNRKSSDILALANIWHQRQASNCKEGETNYIPEFIGAIEDGDIIVELNGNPNHVIAVIIIAVYDIVLLSLYGKSTHYSHNWCTIN